MAMRSGGEDRVDPGRAPGPPGEPPAAESAVAAWPVPTVGGDLARSEARRAGFEAFFRVEYPRLVALLVAVTGQRAVAEELAQEALLRAHVRWDRVGRYDKPGAWVRRVALNLASNHRGRRRNEGRAVERLGRERTTEPYAYDDVAPVTDDFWALVRRLPPRQAAAVALHHLDDLPVADVATILGCTEGTAKTHLHRGRAALAQMLQLPEEDA